jgi:hypothetical protein
MCRSEEAYLAGSDKCAQEYAFIGPLFEGNVEMRFCPVQVDKGGQYDGKFYFSPSEDIVDHNSEGWALWMSRKRSPPGGMWGWGAVESKVDSLDNGIDKMFWDRVLENADE